MPRKTKYLTSAEIKRLQLADYLKHCPNAGPNPNITGMKRKYWGVNAYTVKHGRYVYVVAPHVYNQIRPA